MQVASRQQGGAGAAGAPGPAAAAAAAAGGEGAEVRKGAGACALFASFRLAWPQAQHIRA